MLKGVAKPSFRANDTWQKQNQLLTEVFVRIGNLQCGNMVKTEVKAEEAETKTRGRERACPVR